MFLIMKPNGINKLVIFVLVLRAPKRLSKLIIQDPSGLNPGTLNPKPA